MPLFQKSNGKAGCERCMHTATGYSSIANHPGNRKGDAERIRFFARHIVGNDGNPYTEVGFNGLEDAEKAELRTQMRDALQKAEFQQVNAMGEQCLQGNVYADSNIVDNGTVAVLLHAQVTIRQAVHIFADHLMPSAISFMEDQEAVPDVLFESLLAEMGEELCRSPGGQENALRKVRSLAEALQRGCN